MVCTGFHVRRMFLHKNSMYAARLCAHSPPTTTRAPPHPIPPPLSSSLHLQHLLPSPHYRPLEYPGSPPQPESTSYDPSESSRHRFGSESGSGPVYHPSRKTVVIEFGSELAVQSIFNRNSVDIEFGLPAHWQPHRNPVVVEFGSESAAQSARLSSIGKFEQ